MSHTRTRLLLLVAVAAGGLAALLGLSDEDRRTATEAAPSVGRGGGVAVAAREAGAAVVPDAVGVREPAAVEPSEGERTRTRIRVTAVDGEQQQRTLPGFRFDVRISQYLGQRIWRDEMTLAELTTGAGGVWEGEVEHAVALDDRHDLVLRAMEPGYQRRVTLLQHEVRDEPSTPLVATLRAQKGSSAAGRLVDADGEGVAGRVQFTRSAEVAKYPSFVASYSCNADPRGDFELFLAEKPSFDRGGVIEGTLTATAESGTAVLADQRWSLDDPPRDLVLTIRGAGSLTGVVRDANGAPAPGLPLLIVLDSFAQEGRELAYVGQRAADRLDGNGRVAVEVLTDSGGNFEARGLCVAPYTVRVLAGRESHGPGAFEALTPEPVLADGRHLELTHSRRTIRLTLLTPADEPWRGEIDFPVIDERTPWLPSDWPEAPTVLVAVTRTRAGHRSPSEDPRRSVAGRRLADGSLVLEAKRADELEVRVVGGSAASGFFDGSPLRVEFADGNHRADHAIRASKTAVPLGTVHIRVTTLALPDPGPVLRPPLRGDEPVPELEPELKPEPKPEPKPPPERVPFRADTGYRLVVEDAETDASIAELGPSGPAAPWTLRLPAGRYRLRPWRSPWAGSRFIGGDLPIAPVGDDWVFEVRADEETRYAVESALGARIELTLRADDPDAETGYSYPVLVDAAGREVSLSRETHHPSDIGRSLTWQWPTGIPSESERVPPGRYLLRGTVSPSGRAYERTVVLEEGETLRVTL